MRKIAEAWQTFFEQFADNVFVDGVLIRDPENALYPRITYNYSLNEGLSTSVVAFQVWDFSTNNERMFAVCDKMSKAIPSIGKTQILLPGDVKFEYLHPVSGLWIEFDINDFTSIQAEFAPIRIEWRRTESGNRGKLSVWRGKPFMTPAPKDEINLRAMYGTLEVRYRTSI